MTIRRMGPLVAKELRALVPAWIASAVVIAAAVLSGPRNHELGLVAYGFGSVALGAQSIGHEYTHRTLTLMLSQPLSRRRLLLLKLAVLAAMLLMLTAFAWVTILRPGELLWVFASLLNGFCVAPLLTMACRTPLAAVVFTGAAPFWLMAISRYVGARVVWESEAAASAVAAVVGWRMFMRLEASDRRRDVRVPQLFKRAAAIGGVPPAPARRRHPVWLLVKKELHLQEMTFAATGVCTVIWIGIGAATWIIPGFHGFPVGAVGILYGGLLAVLIGSLASAEERQLGTLEWQVLLPMAAFQQWAVKIATVFTLAGVLTFALPILLAGGRVGVNPWHLGVIVILTTGGLYVSSLCGSGLRALTVSGPLMLTLGLLTLRVVARSDQNPRALVAVPVAGVIVLILWFAFENHRLARQGVGRIVQQAVWIVGGLAVGIAVASAFP